VRPEDFSMGKLAIIIPAYKPDFFIQALESLANQTNTDFQVYIGDDNSPFDLKSVVDSFSHKLNITYKRFDENLGSTDLVAQWTRSVDLIKTEEWLWLFSDDDLAENECVAAFYRALSQTGAKFDAYRFNTTVIDENGRFISEATSSPEIEKSVSLAYNILLWKRGNSMPDHIFSVSAYRSNGGFVNFPFAQGSDWATSIKFAHPKGLYTINAPKVRWRRSATNVSAVRPDKKLEMIEGHLAFLQWVLERFSSPDSESNFIGPAQIRYAAMYNLKAVMKSHYRGVPASGLVSIARQISAIFKISFAAATVLCIRVNAGLVKPKLRAEAKKWLLRSGILKPKR
jgi:glycosyltransferase involved in cell wall biosynthesis